MTRFLLPLLLAAICVVGVGCADDQVRWQTATLPDTGLQQTWNAAVDVMRADYELATASFARGLIETEPKLTPVSGDSRRAGAYLSGGDVQQFRHIVTCRVDRADGRGTLVRVNALRQRLATSQAETLMLGTEGGDRREAGAERAYEVLDDDQQTAWMDVGRNEELERSLLERIRQRVAAEPGLAPAPSPTGEALRQEAERFDTDTDAIMPGAGGETGEGLRREAGRYE